MEVWSEGCWDSTKGFPGEGPAAWRGQELTAVLLEALERPHRDHNVDLSRRGTATTKARYDHLIRVFSAWASARDPGTAEELVEHWSPRVLTECLMAYIQWLYDDDRPISDARWTVAAIGH